MQLQFKNLYIRRFQSVESINLDIDDMGVVVVKGINNYEQNVKSNGSGKSSIFEAIVFALYGETSLGIADPENRILNNGYEVTLKVAINGTTYQIVRKKENDKATVELWQEAGELMGNISGRNKTDTNKMIQNILGISKDIFLDSVFLAQGISTNLSTLSPTARKERLEILTGTEKLIEDFKSYIKNKQLEYEAKCTELTLNKTKLEGNIQPLQQQINTLELKIKEINEENERNKQLGNVADIEKEISDTTQQIEIYELDIQNAESHITNNLENSISKTQLEIDTYKKQKEDIEKQKEDINKELESQREVVYKINSELDALDNNKSNCNREISRLQKEIITIKESDTCPTCGRKYDNANEEHIKSKVLELENEIKKQEEQIKDIDNNIVDKTNILNTETEKGKQIREEYDNKQKEIEEINNKISNQENLNLETNNQIKNQRNLISNKQSQIKELQTKKEQLQIKKEQLLQIQIKDTTEYENMIQEAKTNISNISAEIDTIQTEWNKQNDLVDVCKYSQQLITKPFRTYLLQNSINILNEKLSSLSKRLFSNAKDVIVIDGDDSKLDIRLGNATYESLSGGEKTRVNICLLLAQKYLASSIGDINCNIIVLDEVLGQCDSEAEMNIIDLMVEELQSVSSIIFIGHKELPIPHDKVITVVKDERGLSHLQK